MNKNDVVFIAGGRGLVGSALIRVLKEKGFENILAPTRQELDLFNQAAVLDYFKNNNIAYVIDAAAKVGGIHANNTYRADFIHQNLMIQNNLFDAAFKTNVENFLFLGSSCIYPKEAPQPIKEEYLLTSPLEQTNEPYAIAKIAGLKTAESFNRQYGLNYFSVMPTNLYGINDNFHPENSHVIPGLIQRMDQTIKNGDKEFTIWGTGNPRREFLYVDDLAEACIFLLESGKKLPYLINVGSGSDVTIKDLAKLIGQIMGFKGTFKFDTTRPDGTMLKCMDNTLIKSLGWKPKYNLEEGLSMAINFYATSSDVKK